VVGGGRGTGRGGDGRWINGKVAGGSDGGGTGRGDDGRWRNGGETTDRRAEAAGSSLCRWVSLLRGAFPHDFAEWVRPGLPTEVRALNEFLVSREWWGRSWVVQEFCLAKASPAICGALVIPMDALLVAITELRGGQVDGMPYSITW